MARHATKSQLLRSQLREAEIPIPGKGMIRVRELSRSEVVDELNAVDRSSDPALWEATLVALSLVAPVLSVEEVAEWRTSSEPHEIGAVIDKLTELSALTRDAAKAAWKEMESEPGAEFRAVPGSGAVDDGGAAEG